MGYTVYEWIGVSSREFDRIFKSGKCVRCGKPVCSYGHTLCRGHHSAYHKWVIKHKKRLEDSRYRFKQVLDKATLLYIEHERTKGDSWRDINYGNLWGRFLDEINEIDTAKTNAEKLHNILDAINYLGMLGGKLYE